MTKTLELALERLKQMPEDRQDSLAQLLLYEMEEDERWQKSTAQHSEKLSGLVTQVLDAERCGEREMLDPDRL